MKKRFQSYYDYLHTRSSIGLLYRKLFLYPKISKNLIGLTLDFGCGIGDFLRYRTNTVGVDINPLLVRDLVEQDIECSLINKNKIPFENDYFESILLDNVLEHLERPDAILSEITRVLKDNGRLVVGVPGQKGFLSDDDHKIFYDEPSLDNLFEKGFKKINSFNTPFKLKLEKIFKAILLIRGLC